MKKPSYPYNEPKKPLPPPTEIEKPNKKYEINDGDRLRDILDDLTLEEINNAEFLEFGEDRDCSWLELVIPSTEMIPNPSYQADLYKYNKRLKKYNTEYEKYQKELKQYYKDNKKYLEWEREQQEKADLAEFERLKLKLKK